MDEPVAADRPQTLGGQQYHLRVASGDMAPTVLLPGDPGRVPILAQAWDDAVLVAENREYRSMRGTCRGTTISACSTGIGGPSTEIAVNELAAIGCTNFLRLGTTGSLQARIQCGDIIISTAAIRWDGAGSSYVPDAYPAAASYEMVVALVEASERLGFRYHLGVSATVASFYAAQSRPSFGGYHGHDADRVDRLTEMGVLNFEMEAATLLTLCSLFGLRGGAACVAIADRVRNEWRPEGADEALARLGAETAVVLAEHDALKRQAGKDWYFPGLHSPFAR
jgi:uridine phosphorylase